MTAPALTGRTSSCTTCRRIARGEGNLTAKPLQEYLAG